MSPDRMNPEERVAEAEAMADRVRTLLLSAAKEGLYTGPLTVNIHCGVPLTLCAAPVTGSRHGFRFPDLNQP